LIIQVLKHLQQTQKSLLPIKQQYKKRNHLKSLLMIELCLFNTIYETHTTPSNTLLALNFGIGVTFI